VFGVLCTELNVDAERVNAAEGGQQGFAPNIAQSAHQALSLRYVPDAQITFLVVNVYDVIIWDLDKSKKVTFVYKNRMSQHYSHRALQRKGLHVGLHLPEGRVLL